MLNIRLFHKDGKRCIWNFLNPRSVYTRDYKLLESASMVAIDSSTWREDHLAEEWRIVETKGRRRRRHKRRQHYRKNQTKDMLYKNNVRISYYEWWQRTNCNSWRVSIRFIPQNRMANVLSESGGARLSRR